VNVASILVACSAALAAGPDRVEQRGEIRTVKVGPSTRAALVQGDDTKVLAARRPGLDEELQNLDGATVVVKGYRDPGLRPPGTDLVVESYEILDVGDGRVPRLGRLAVLALGEETKLLFVDEAGRADVLPESWKKRMIEHVGAKLWVIGRRASDGSYTPTRFRILRAGPEDGAP
jgi:hypothetical protein